MNFTQLQVQGMTCGACVRHVTQALNTVSGVNAVEVDLQSGRVRVDGDADNAALIAALDEAGYPAQLAPQTTPDAAPKKGCGSGCGCR
ncbi:CopZ family metallochaperone [Stutzerimonas zhaodongensis]|jgi:copper chaperone|uniref:CopZ family metallochaperone n=1 Tax=Stutzerimonas zhaodongensis TaxID=1176257 RepID=UPI001F4EC0A5|nr:heavy-metal-associated domain-containing protein [Stutzerimonas zhaodongensis]UNG17318.1 heavy-metal-associated domain-containing protein [Stutzerimonas zhaodongensis]